ncbi:MAG: copper amine oxidase N-terminal domain-containing protein [Clostridiales bacterium]|jgi:hypothetical protein|nr:copper amine oxidase N-terminal domain-containing protein [Clostridiales bacterium]
MLSKLLSIGLIFLASVLMPSQALPSEAWMELYKEYLSGSSAQVAGLYDVDGDGTPELISRTTDIDVISIVNGKAENKATIKAGSESAYLAGSDGKGIYVLYREGDSLSYSISRLDEEFKLTEVGSVESSYTELDFNTSKILSEKFYLGGKEVTKREFQEQSPVREPIGLTKIEYTSKEVTDFAIDALLSAYPLRVGDPGLNYSLTQDQDLAWTGLYALYPDFSYDQFPYPNVNNSELPENWVLMIDGTFVPSYGISNRGGEAYVPVEAFSGKLAANSSAFKPTLIDGNEYVPASEIPNAYGVKVSVNDLFSYAGLKVLAIESETVEQSYTKEYALGIIKKEFDSRIEADEKSMTGYSPAIFKEVRALQFESMPDLGGYYVFGIPEVKTTVLFNKATGAIFSGTYYTAAGVEPGLDNFGGIVENYDYNQVKAPETNLAGVTIMGNMTPPQVRYSDGSVESFPGGFTGLFINGSIIKNANVTLESGRSLVPLRLISETLGATVGWDEKTSTVTINDGDHMITLVIGSTSPQLDGKEIQIDVAPRIIGGYTYVPLRFIAESLSCSVEWSDGGEGGAGYVTGMPHAIVSRYPETAIAMDESAAVELVKQELADAYEEKYLAKMEPLSQKPASASLQDSQRYTISSLGVTSGNDRFYFFKGASGTSLWVDKYSNSVLVYENGEEQNIYAFNPYATGALDILEGF